MLRMEIEIAVLEGKIAVKDLPEVWNDKMKSYLGIVPSNNAEGVLQDVHWSGGMMGYFPTYALGNIVSAQVWDKLNVENPNLADQIGRGEFKPMLSWLADRIYQHGSKFEPKQIIRNISGGDLEAAPYIHYLENKYQDIYNL
jgi:carboxypeptidase Taq